MARRPSKKQADAKVFSPLFYIVEKLTREFVASTLSPSRFAASENISEDILWKGFQAHDNELLAYLEKELWEIADLKKSFRKLKRDMDKHFTRSMQYAESLSSIPRSNKNYVTFLDEEKITGPEPEYKI